MKKLELENKPYIIKEKRYNTVKFLFLFPIVDDNFDTFSFSLLQKIMMNSTKKYDTEAKILNIKRKNMIINLFADFEMYNGITYFNFEMIVPDPKIVSNYDIEEAFKLLIDIIYNPYIKNNEFDLVTFEKHKNELKNNIYSYFKTVERKSYAEFLDVMDDNGILKKDNMYLNLDLIEKSNSKDLYNLYRKNIKNNTPLIFVYGNVDESINKMISKYVNFCDNKINIVPDYYNYLKARKEAIIVETEGKDNQSILYLAYKLDKMTKKEEIYFSLLVSLIHNEHLLHKKLRIEKELVYSSSVNYKYLAGTLVFTAYINNASKEETINGIEDILNSLKNEELLNKYIKNLLISMEYTTIRNKDVKGIKLSKFIIKKLKNGITLEDKQRKFKKINPNDLIKFIDRLKLDTIYFLRGEFND